MRIDLVMRGVPILLMGIYIIQNTVYKVVKKVIKINWRYGHWSRAMPQEQVSRSELKENHFIECCKKKII